MPGQGVEGGVRVEEVTEVEAGTRVNEGGAVKDGDRIGIHEVAEKVAQALSLRYLPSLVAAAVIRTFEGLQDEAGYTRAECEARVKYVLDHMGELESTLLRLVEDSAVQAGRDSVLAVAGGANRRQEERAEGGLGPSDDKTWSAKLGELGGP